MADGNIDFTLLQGLRKTIAVLNPAQKKKGIAQVGLLVVSGALEVLGLAAILPIVAVIQDPTLILKSEILSYAYTLFGFERNDYFILFLLVLLFLLFILKNGVGILIHMFQSRYVFEIAKNLVRKQFYRAMQTEYLDFRQEHSGRWIRDILSTPHFYSTSVLLPAISFASEFIVVLFIFGGMAIYDFALVAGVLLLMGPAFVIIYQAVRRKVTSLGEKKFAIEPEVFTNLQEVIVGIVDAKMSGRNEFFLRRFFKPKIVLFNIVHSLNVYSAIPLRIFESFAILGIVFISAYSIVVTKSSAAMVEYITFFAIATYRILPSLNRMMTAIMTIKNNYYTLPLLAGARDLEPATESPEDLNPIPFEKNIRFENVSFRYADKEHHALNGVTFEVSKGEKVGFIGESGSGKSTLMNILLRLIDQTGGNMLVDGKPIRSEQKRAWWRQVGYVKQDVFLIRATLMENIALGEQLKDIDVEKINSAIRDAGLSAFVEDLPMGLHTRIEEAGSNFSGGQKQRIGIARALYKNAAVLVFDEATSHLDQKTEEVVTESIDHLSRQGKTILIIAHRHSTLRNCDRIFELRNGKIIREGTFAEINS